MKSLILIIVLTLPTGIFAQENMNLQQQGKNVNYYNQKKNSSSIQTNIQQDQPLPQMAQGNTAGSLENNIPENKPCKDCEEVKAAIKATHSSSGIHHGRSFSIKQWSKKVSGKMHLKMKKAFFRSKKVKTNYAVCFNWR